MADREGDGERPPASRERERWLAELAARQHRAVGDRQLLAMGFGRGAIRYRISCGRLQRIHPGVLIVGPGRPTREGLWRAALLACLPSPALSHLSAAADRGLARERGIVHVTIPRRSTRRLDGVCVHEARYLDPLDLTRSADDLPVTALHRTLLDLAEILPFDRFKKVFEEADRRQWLDFGAIRACMARNPGRHGLKPLALLLDDYLSAAGSTKGLGRDFQEFLAEEGFPPPLLDTLVEGLLVDCYWPDQRFVVELDSRGYHRHWGQHERDRARDGVLLRAGRRSLRVTNRRLTRERGELIADLVAVLPRKLS